MALAKSEQWDSHFCECSVAGVGGGLATQLIGGVGSVTTSLQTVVLTLTQPLFSPLFSLLAKLEPALSFCPSLPKEPW